jgi:hypothetical protein
MLPVKDMARAPLLRRAARPAAARRQAGRQVRLPLRRHGGRAVPKPEGTKAEHTALSFRVDNIADAIAQLKSRGVAFADYDFPGLKTEGHVCVLGSEKAAWFEDTEGNILCLHEDLV